MTLGTYISGLVQVQGRPQYEWNDWQCRDYFMWDPPEDYATEMSDAAAFALLVASAEWINRRFNALDADPMLGFVIRAGWSYMMEPEACLYFEPTDALWRGPVRAPLSVTAVILMDALYCRDTDPEVRTRTFWMANFAKYCLEGDAETFEAWFNWASARLAKYHPKREMSEQGLFDYSGRFEPAVGRSIFDPDATYDPANARQELYQYLMAGDRENPFIDFAELKP